MKKRILIFSTAYFPLVGGAEVAVKEITDRILDTEFVMITARLSTKFPSEEKIGNITVHRLGKGNKWDKFRLILSGYKKAKELGSFNVVWSIMASYAGFATLRYKIKNPKVPFLLTLQEGDSKWDIYKHVWWCWWYFKYIFKKANRIQAISNYLATWAKNLGATCPVEVVPNGVDVEKFQIPNSKFQIDHNDRISDTRQKLNLSPDAKIVITASRLVKKNGVGSLIPAIRFLSPNTYLLIAGTGELEGSLKDEVERLGIKPRVHFLGAVSHVDLPKYLWASDVFCRPSLSEGLGNAFLEAMAAGVPVVATNVGGIPDFLVDGETGLFCLKNNPMDIAAKIKRIFGDSSLAKRLKTNGQQLIQEKYSWSTIAAQMKIIFERL